MKNKEPVPAADPGFSYDDYRRAFIAGLQGLISRHGLLMAEEGHFRTMAANIGGLAMAAEREMRKHRPPSFGSKVPYDTGGTL